MLGTNVGEGDEIERLANYRGCTNGFVDGSQQPAGEMTGVRCTRIGCAYGGLLLGAGNQGASEKEGCIPNGLWNSHDEISHNPCP
jgi:hypothetical protein